jgi:RND family efflux transporter MFP subunit
MNKYLKLSFLGIFPLVGAYFAYSIAFGARSPTKVATVELQIEPAQLVLAVVGRVRSHAVVDIRSERPGAIREMMHDEGDIVEAGEVLAHIQSDEEQANLSVNRAQLQALEAEVALAQVTLNRTETLADKGLLAPAALDDARARLATAKANKKAAQAAIIQAQARVDEYDVRAPMQGIILSRPLDPGQVVGTTDMIFQIGSQDAVEIEAEVDEYYADKLQVGMSALLAPSGSSDVYEGELKEIAPRIDPLTGGRIVRLLPKTDTEAFLPGRSVDVNILVDSIERALSVSRSALVREGGAWRVYVLEDGKATPREIEFIDWPGGSVVIMSGLEAGDQVILESLRVKSGMTVKPTDSTDPKVR